MKANEATLLLQIKSLTGLLESEKQQKKILEEALEEPKSADSFNFRQSLVPFGRQSVMQMPARVQKVIRGQKLTQSQALIKEGDFGAEVEQEAESSGKLS